MIKNFKPKSSILFVNDNNITGMPLRGVVHVQKGYMVNNLVDI